MAANCNRRLGDVHKLYNARGVGWCRGCVISVILWGGGWIVRCIWQGNYKWFMVLVHNAHCILTPPVYSILVTVMPLSMSTEALNIY